MRQVKFKAKSVQYNKWIYGYYWYTEENYMPSKSNIHYIKSINNGLDYEIDIETLCQFTGILDRNGTELYENDIVEYQIWNEPSLVGQIEYRNGFYLCFYNSSNILSLVNLSKYSTSIGNVYNTKKVLDEKA